jgi:hypothetical protein
VYDSLSYISAIADKIHDLFDDIDHRMDAAAVSMQTGCSSTRCSSLTDSDDSEAGRCSAANYLYGCLQAVSHVPNSWKIAFLQEADPKRARMMLYEKMGKTLSSHVKPDGQVQPLSVCTDLTIAPLVGICVFGPLPRERGFSKHLC